MGKDVEKQNGMLHAKLSEVDPEYRTDLCKESQKADTIDVGKCIKATGSWNNILVSFPVAILNILTRAS